MPKRHFTLAQANSLIARIRPRIERMMQLSVHLRSSGGGAAPRDVADSDSDVIDSDAIADAIHADAIHADAIDSDAIDSDASHDATPTPITPTPPGTPWMADPVVAAWQADNDVDKSRELAACLYETLSEQLQGIEQLGAEVKDLSIGLTVFPSYLEGHTEVLLAWTVGDAEIRAFYAPLGGYRSRKSVEGCRFTADRAPAGQLRE